MQTRLKRSHETGAKVKHERTNAGINPSMESETIVARDREFIRLAGKIVNIVSVIRYLVRGIACQL